MSDPKTDEEIRKKLGFKPWHEHVAEVVKQNEAARRVTLGDREYYANDAWLVGTGRTTRMLIRGLAVLSQGRRVYFEGRYSEHTTMLYKMAVEYAKKLRLDSTRVVKNPLTSPVFTSFRDHFSGGR